MNKWQLEWRVKVGEEEEGGVGVQVRDAEYRNGQRHRERERVTEKEYG